MDGDLVPGTRVVGLGDKLEAVGYVGGPPSLVAIGASRIGVIRLATVAAEIGVEAAAAFLLSKWGAGTPGAIDVHSVGGRGLLLLLQAGQRGLGNGLGDERGARGVLELIVRTILVRVPN